jgi:hypothetical protein
MQTFTHFLPAMSQPSHQPASAHISTLSRLRRLSHVLDQAIRIPGTSFRFGLDPLLGLLPGGGDFVGTALSAYIVIEAARMGIPRAALVQMVSNIMLDTVVGTVPVLGDLADVTWKANTKNIRLIEDHLGAPHPQQRRKVDWLFLALLLGGLLLVVVVVAAISVMVLRWLIGVISR